MIGLGEITISAPDGEDLTVSADENGNPVIKPGSDTDSIGLTLEIGGDGGIGVGNVRDATKRPSKPGGKPPQTGDSGIALYVLLTAVGTGPILLILARGKKRRKV